MAEYQDALDRARRLSIAEEAALAGSESAMNVVTLDDLLIYTRSLICQLHSVKKIHAFLKVRKNPAPHLYSNTQICTVVGERIFVDVDVNCTAKNATDLARRDANFGFYRPDVSYKQVVSSCIRSVNIRLAAA